MRKATGRVPDAMVASGSHCSIKLPAQAVPRFVGGVDLPGTSGLVLVGVRGPSPGALAKGACWAGASLSPTPRRCQSSAARPCRTNMDLGIDKDIRAILEMAQS